MGDQHLEGIDLEALAGGQVGAQGLQIACEVGTQP